MTTSIHTVGGGPALHAVGVLHCMLPLLAILYYILSASIGVFCDKLQKTSRDTQVRGLMTVKLWLVTSILITYVIDSTLLLHLSFSGEAVIAQDSLVFSLSSALLWFALLLAYAEPQTSSWHSLAGCSVMYLLAETFFVVVQPCQKPEKPLLAVLDNVQIFRLFVLVFLLVFAFWSRILSGRHRQSDEETPLLGDRGSHNRNRCRGNNNYPSYGTMAYDEYEGPESELEEEDSYYWGDFGILTFLLPFFWPRNKLKLQLLYGGVGFCFLVGRIVTVLVPLQLGQVVNNLSNNSGKMPWKDIVILVLLRYLDSSGGVTAIRKHFWLPLENYSYFRISTAAFDKIMGLSSDFHDSRDSTHLWESVNRGLSIRYSFRTMLFKIIPMIIDLIVAFGVLYYMFDVYMTLIVASVVLFFLWSSSRFQVKQQDKRSQFIADIDMEQRILCESTSKWKTATYFNRIPCEMARYHSAVTRRLSSSFRVLLWSNFELAAQSFLLMFGLLCACLLAAYQVTSGTKSVGSFVTLLGYWAQLSSPLLFFASGICDIALHVVNARELVKLLKIKAAVVDQDGARPLAISRGMIQVKGVDFAYDSFKHVLKKISFQVLPGQTVALVGETGEGKTTILNLILRLYDPLQGTITIDGQNISKATLQSLRANIGIIPQNPVLFNDTILNNIKYANPSASDHQIYEASKSVGLHGKISVFSAGYQTLVGENGVKLSAGELRQIAIARVIIKNPKIVLLDETSGILDSNTETQIQQGLQKLCRGRTTLVVAHRLSTIVNADKILVVHDGKILEQGSHNSLLQANGYYSRLWAHQQTVDLYTAVISGTLTGAQRKVVGSLNGESYLDGESSLPDYDSLLGTVTRESATGPLKKTYKLVESPGEGPSLQEVRSSNSNIGGKSTEAHDAHSKKSVWKPDVPDFIPSSKLTLTTDSQAHRPTCDQGVGTSWRGTMRSTGSNENIRPSTTTSHDNSKKIFSTFELYTDTSRSDNLSAPSLKSHSAKAKKPKIRHNLRRELTKSEPTDMGVTPM